VNKTGTAALAAIARLHGTIVVVVAGREKILPQTVFDSLPLAGDTAEEGRAPGVIRREVLFEKVPAGLVDHVVLDRGVVTPDEVESGSFWTIPMLTQYMSLISAYNMLDKG
jgi:translation initiation factor 2B subunit (eIF-2B alpha/beta/delta family)